MYLLIGTFSYTANIEFHKGGGWLIVFGILHINNFIFHYEHLFEYIKRYTLFCEYHIQHSSIENIVFMLLFKICIYQCISSIQCGRMIGHYHYYW